MNALGTVWTAHLLNLRPLYAPKRCLLIPRISTNLFPDHFILLSKL
jgi:hypothetical protein